MAELPVRKEIVLAPTEAQEFRQTINKWLNYLPISKTWQKSPWHGNRLNNSNRGWQERLVRTLDDAQKAVATLNEVSGELETALQQTLTAKQLQAVARIMELTYEELDVNWDWVDVKGLNEDYKVLLQYYQEQRKLVDARSALKGKLNQNLNYKDFVYYVAELEYTDQWQIKQWTRKELQQMHNAIKVIHLHYLGLYEDWGELEELMGLSGDVHLKDILDAASILFYLKYPKTPLLTGKISTIMDYYQKAREYNYQLRQARKTIPNHYHKYITNKDFIKKLKKASKNPVKINREYQIKLTAEEARELHDNIIELHRLDKQRQNNYEELQQHVELRKGGWVDGWKALQKWCDIYQHANPEIQQQINLIALAVQKQKRFPIDTLKRLYQRTKIVQQIIHELDYDKQLTLLAMQQEDLETWLPMWHEALAFLNKNSREIYKYKNIEAALKWLPKADQIINIQKLEQEATKRLAKLKMKPYGDEAWETMLTQLHDTGRIQDTKPNDLSWQIIKHIINTPPKNATSIISSVNNYSDVTYRIGKMFHDVKQNAIQQLLNNPRVAERFIADLRQHVDDLEDYNNYQKLRIEIHKKGFIKQMQYCEQQAITKQQAQQLATQCIIIRDDI